MSRARLHVFVEGHDSDAFVYGNCCRQVCPSHFEYRIVYARELVPSAGGAGGKAVLLRTFDLLRGSRALTGRNGIGRTYSTVFCLDKDVDDLRRTRRRSRHVLYTRYYDIENELMRDGQLAMAIAAALSADIGKVEGCFPSAREWCRYASHNWIEWVAVCAAGARDNLPITTYGRSSPFNVPATAPTDEAAVRAFCVEMAGRLGTTVAEFEDRYVRSLRRVERLARRDELDRVFKGRWYFDIIDEEVRTRLPDEYRRTPSFKDVLRAALHGMLDCEAPWIVQYRDRIESAARLPQGAEQE
jgi:hypothetical protein